MAAYMDDYNFNQSDVVTCDTIRIFTRADVRVIYIYIQYPVQLAKFLKTWKYTSQTG